MKGLREDRKLCLPKASNESHLEEFLWKLTVKRNRENLMLNASLN